MKLRFLIIVTCSLSLTACMIDSENSNTYDPYSTRPSSMLYPDSYESPINEQDIYDPTPAPAPQVYTAHNYSVQTSSKSPKVLVPETYHVNQIHGPVSVQDVDRNWVNQQNPNHYTIELAQANKASQVASVLAKAPKQARTAEVQTNSHGQAYYTGVYGTYTDQAAAKEALNNLPEDLKQNAHVEAWKQVQS